MSMFQNSNHINPSFLTVAWVVFTLFAMGTAIAKYDAGGVGIFSWFVCIGGIVLGLLSKY